MCWKSKPTIGSIFMRTLKKNFTALFSILTIFLRLWFTFFFFLPTLSLTYLCHHNFHRNPQIWKNFRKVKEKKQFETKKVKKNWRLPVSDIFYLFKPQWTFSKMTSSPFYFLYLRESFPRLSAVIFSSFLVSHVSTWSVSQIFDCGRILHCLSKKKKIEVMIIV